MCLPFHVVIRTLVRGKVPGPSLVSTVSPPSRPALLAIVPSAFFQKGHVTVVSRDIGPTSWDRSLGKGCTERGTGITTPLHAVVAGRLGEYDSQQWMFVSLQGFFLFFLFFFFFSFSLGATERLRVICRYVCATNSSYFIDKAHMI